MMEGPDRGVPTDNFFVTQYFDWGWKKEGRWLALPTPLFRPAGYTRQ